MKLKITISSTMTLVFIFIFIFALNSCTMLTPAETTPMETSVKEQESTETEATAAKETETTVKDTTSDQIKVTKPQPNQIIQSPLTIEGEARGSWFFEGVFPIMLLDSNGNAIARHFAQVQGEWMTEDFVLFKAELIFEKPSTDTGILILEKDNPSGLSENDASIEIPVRFDQSVKIVEGTDPQKGEYFVSAILKSIDAKNNKIIVEQLINEPNEKEISPEVKLSESCKIVKVILERPDEKETVSEISLDSIKLGSEIGIIFTSNNIARAIIYQEIIEK
jgi:hypothetical protein